MKRVIIVLISFIFFSAAVNSQSIKTHEIEKSFFLDGSLKGKDTGTIILIYPKDNKQWVQDTSYVTKGKFSFGGKVLQPGFCTLKSPTGNGNYANFFLEEGQQQILVQDTKFEDFILSGSYTQSQDDTLKQQIKLIELKYKDANDKYAKLVSDYKKATDSLSKLKVYEEGSQILDWIRIEKAPRDWLCRYPHRWGLRCSILHPLFRCRPTGRSPPCGSPLNLVEGGYCAHRLETEAHRPCLPPDACRHYRGLPGSARTPPSPSGPRVPLSPEIQSVNTCSMQCGTAGPGRRLRRLQPAVPCPLNRPWLPTRARVKPRWSGWPAPPTVGRRSLSAGAS